MPNYKDEANAIRARTKDQPIKVMVWGPGDPGANASADKKKAYDKRLQIKQVLSKVFHNSEVMFPEDKEIEAITGWIKGQLRREALQARIADLVLMLDLGRGVDLEIDHFVLTYSWFARKVYLLVPEKYVSTKGLVKEVYEYLRKDQIEGFSEDEFDKCLVATVKAIRAVEESALMLILKPGE